MEAEAAGFAGDGGYVIHSRKGMRAQYLGNILDRSESYKTHSPVSFMALFTFEPNGFSNFWIKHVASRKI